VPEVKPEDCFTLEAKVGTAEHDFGQIPTQKFGRVIYRIVLSELSGANNDLTLRQYADDGTTLEKEWTVRVQANDTIHISGSTNSPILVIPAGKYIKAVATVDHVQVILSCYDL